MAVTIHLIGIPLVLLVGLIIGGFVGFLLGLRAGAKRSDKPVDTQGSAED
jgi:membrane protein DedA with SNARE-associated domain